LLRFQLQQIHILSLGRYFLPLPKLTDLQLKLLSAHLEGRGFSVRPGSGPRKRIALKGAQRIAIDGRLGLASSGDDLLDAIAPAVPELLASPKEGVGKIASDGAARYFSLKRSGASVELQLFPRLESLRTWTFLRKDGMCGLTPDEASVLKQLLGRASPTSQVECVTAGPRQGSTPLQVGRKVYYKSAVAVTEFLSSLRTVGSGRADSASYLPRDSVMELRGAQVETRIRMEELGEWCYLG